MGEKGDVGDEGEMGMPGDKVGNLWQMNPVVGSI